VHVCVTAQAVAEVVSSWTGIPVGRMQADEIQGVIDLAARMEQRIIGQDHALETIAERIGMSRAGLTDPRRPIGVFLLVGPSGVGKTETAVVLAETLYGGEKNLISVNMSEFQESHTVSLLKGSPPGYVGYGEGGVLTEAVRRKPHSVVLLDEVEKAHPDVMELFYQVFDKGTLDDGEGLDIDFRHTVILLTTNVGSDLILALTADPAKRPTSEELVDALRPVLYHVFKPALIGRMTIVPYLALTDEVLRKIAHLQLRKVGSRLADQQGATFEYDEALAEQIASRCTEVDTGARNVDMVLTRTVLPALSKAVLGRLMTGQPVSRVHAGLDDKGELKVTVE
jgi:type VI secretion system protein VasG